VSNPFDIIVLDGSTVVAATEAETPEDAVYAGRITHDEALPGRVAKVGKLTVLFLHDGVLVRQVEGRP